MKNVFFFVLAIVFTVGSGFISTPDILAQPMEMKAISFVSTNNPMTVMAQEWIDRVNREAKGELTIKYLGGPEVIPTPEQPEATRKGVVQILFGAGSFYESLLPENMAYILSKLSCEEERKPGGFYDFMVERHKRIGLMYLGRWFYGPFHLWTKDPVRNVKDLAGRKMRTAGLYDRFMKGLGIVPVTVSPADVYTALERGIVDGFGWPIIGPRDSGWVEKCKYVIEQPFYYAQNTLILMNLDAWNKLPKTLQAKLAGLTAKFEPDMVAHFQKEIEKEWEALKKAGVKPVKLSPEEAKYYVDTAHRVEWEALEKKVPDLVPRLKSSTGN